jgi:DNA-binding NtrC family response regulator
MRALLPNQHDMPSRRRLEALGVVCRPYRAPHVPEIDAESAGWVCVVDDSILHSELWPRQRVQLARANRFFVQIVPEPDTARIAEAMRDGAFDVIAATDADDRWRSALQAASEGQELWWQLYGGRANGAFDRLIGSSKVMSDLRRDIQRLGPTDVTVLIIGESGCGKERVAGALHAAGLGGPFVTLNCAAMPRDLLEAELFGSERGAFTGSLKSRHGLVEQANGGTLFLDEIGELDLALQPKLLRFLETRTARRVGGDKEYSVRIRVVSATNRNLENDVNLGRFRADLYFRLAEMILRPAPLRERAADVPELAMAFLETANERFGKNFTNIEPGLLQKLRLHPWPGNVRELKSVIERLVLFHDGPILREGWWEPLILVGHNGADHPFRPPSVLPAPTLGIPFPTQTAGAAALPAGHRLPTRSDRLNLARQLLEENDLSLAEVAARTGVHPTTLFRWRKSGRV